MPQLENNEIGIEEIVLMPEEVIDIQGIPYDPLLPSVDLFFDSMDAIAHSFTSLTSFNEALDSAFSVLEGQIDAYFIANKDRPKEQTTVVVTGRRASGLGGIARLLPTAGATGGGGTVSQQELANLRANLKILFPGTTDAELDELAAQISASPAAVWALVQIGNVNMRSDASGPYAVMSARQARLTEGLLRSLNTPLATTALNRFRTAINTRRVRILPRG